MSNSGFDFTKRTIPLKIIDEIYGFTHIVDKKFCEEYKNELNYLAANKGKFVGVYDDETGRKLTNLEVQEIEEREELRLPYLIMQSEKDVVKMKEELIKINKKHRRYKPKRIVVSAKQRQEIYRKYQSRCNKCKVLGANQIHHIDGNSSNTWLSNLELLCYDCHLDIEGKIKYDLENKK